MTASWTWPNWSFLRKVHESDFIWTIPLLTMIWEKWACHDFGASLRPYKLTLETPDRRLWIGKFSRCLNKDRWFWGIHGGVEESWGYVWNRDFPRMEWIWLMRRMSLRVVAWGVEAYLSSLEMTCLNPFAQKRPLSSLPGRGPMTHRDSMIERRSSWLMTKRNRIIGIMTLRTDLLELFVIASLIWSAEYPWRSPWYHSWRMRPWSNSSSDWASWWSALIWSWVMGRWFSLMSWRTAEISADSFADSFGVDFFVILLRTWTGCWSNCWGWAGPGCWAWWRCRGWSPGGIWTPGGWGMTAGWGTEVDVDDAGNDDDLLIRSLGWWSRDWWASVLNNDLKSLIQGLEVFVLHLWFLLHDSGTVTWADLEEQFDLLEVLDSEVRIHEGEEWSCWTPQNWIAVLWSNGWLSGFENLTLVSHNVHSSDDTFPQPQWVVLLRLSSQMKLLGGRGGLNMSQNSFPRNEPKDLNEPCWTPARMMSCHPDEWGTCWWWRQHVEQSMAWDELLLNQDEFQDEQRVQVWLPWPDHKESCETFRTVPWLWCEYGGLIWVGNERSLPTWSWSFMRPEWPSHWRTLWVNPLTMMNCLRALIPTWLL